ncbi:hypothetical protein SprV_0200707200 [Sparganum proliferum]
MDQHLLTLVLQLAGGEDHVRGPTMRADAAVAFRQETLFQVVVQTAEKNVSKDFPGEVQQGDVSMVVADLEVPFPAGLLLDATSPGRVPSDDPWVGAAVLVDLSRDCVRSGRFPAGELLHGLDGFL